MAAMRSDPFDDANLSRKATDWPTVPRSFSPEDVIDFYDNPFATLEQLRDTWRSKDRDAPWSTDKLSDLDLGDVDWHKYGPPAMLRKAPNVTSQILLDIVAASIDNVKARIVEEDRQRLEEERRRATEEEAVRQARNGKGPEPYLPIIIVPDEPPPEAANDAPVPAQTTNGSRAEANGSGSVPPSTSAAAFAAKVEKRRKFALRRLFHRSPEKGESSSAGGAREALRQKLEAKLDDVDISAADSNTQKTILELRKSGFFKAPDPDELLECVSCLDDIPRKDCVKVPCHSYCRECFVRLVAAAVRNEQQWPPKCCLNQIPFRTILAHIPDDLKKTFQERASEWEIPVSERVYCNQPECALWIQPRNITLAKRQGRCERGHTTCTICRGPHHGRDDCPQDRDMDLTNILAEEEGWKRCSRCHALVEHREACQHMTCRCGNEFCYVCGLHWGTCSCTMQQLNALKDAAQGRREQRRIREQAEATELREILAQIEEFEREEARRAELERLEQARLAEERWQRQLKERIRQENIRRREVELKYEELRARLDELHELQQVLVDSQQEEDATDLTKESQAMKRQLAEKQDTERADLDALVLSRMATKEQTFTKDYAIRAAQERKVEQEYRQQLQEFWSGKTGADVEVETAMFPLRKRMDQGHRAWQKWKGEQLALYRSRLDDERTIREELMYSAAQNLAGLYEGRETELIRKMVAEKKWVQEVILERERLLGAMEVQEMEGDADIEVDATFWKLMQGSRPAVGALAGATDGDEACHVGLGRGRRANRPLAPAQDLRRREEAGQVPVRLRADGALQQGALPRAPAVSLPEAHLNAQLAFRQTVHKYGVDLCWTPMILAKEFNRSSIARDSDLTVSTAAGRAAQPPTILQFGANCPLELSRASALAAPYVAGVDLNCGCPQAWACAEALGAALMGRRELVRDMVVETRARLAAEGWAVGRERDMESPRGRSVSVKIRVHDDLRKTMDFLDTVVGHPQDRLVDWITIHPRTRRTPSTTPIRTEALEILTSRYAGTLPILLSGDVFDLSSLPFRPSTLGLSALSDDAPTTTHQQNGPLDSNAPTPSNTNLAGFMSARGLLANPALFASAPSCPWHALETFMCNVARCPLPFKLAVHHVSEMCGPGMGADKTALLPKRDRIRLTELGSMMDLVDFLDEKLEEHTGRKGGLRRDL
ncbi:tRNA-dihydrouridine(20a/20b) synthase [NAD(P)+]-like protein [Tolypocladium ophioglossoides CBS 100239]|uniref:tRNA-dihydrouridine(20a/20b) synthase [NAD(P)+]-like protein n=1 Tax=Tolypocladium ophioglossoides (strain CBS 100239) TaxID=1163406 RepID=A0A0L0N8T5_TOLOC|nr:tRNA-dihydrouridine(20a/20b) synthase [NAD(P)+]-like protein [Tolypocladium ophioglossoides CBS 100239]